ncbi:MAG: AMP-binding protein [Deltaproteobacteria bacterium]|jgi:acyl-[acyl-carrier-protein]-phospholipid O-acyltransferase/long-chain-fatty-acid--[acyl-carrier-protein] ligase|nr:AMP-binding protein [Deltaproteobacteria bacterium]
MFFLLTKLQKSFPDFTESLARFICQVLVTFFFRPRVRGIATIDLPQESVVLISNRTSRADAAILGALIKRPLTLVLDRVWPESRLVKLLSFFQTVLRVDYDKPLAGQGVSEALAAGSSVVIFPEAVPTISEVVMKVVDEAAIWLCGVQAPIIYVDFDGPQYGYFGDAKNTIVHRPKRSINRVTFHPFPQDTLVLEGPPARLEVRRRASRALHSAMVELRFWSRQEEFNRNLWVSLIDAKNRFGGSKVVLEDIARKPLNYRQFVAEARRWASLFAPLTRPGEPVGLLFVNGIPQALSMFGLWSIGRVPVFLNYSQGLTLLKASLKTAQVTTIITSGAFIKNLGLGDIFEGTPGRFIDTDLFSESGTLDRIRSYIPDFFFDRKFPAAGETAAILFTSGSEGLPKGVVHTHRSLLSNAYQVVALHSLGPDDIIINAMPLFHTMGLNPLFLLPMLFGLRSFLYISPLHAHTIPRLAYELKATFIVASDTFANAWAKEAHQADFGTIKFFLAGSEQIKAKTHELFLREFGVRILEGYGVSEAAPAIFLNSLYYYRCGSCGVKVPGLELMIEPVEGVAQGGILKVKGPNIMSGYLFSDRPGVLVPPKDGWHDTGDIVEIDPDGFGYIRGRFKRFAKIAGEMISLVTIEDVVNKLWPGQPQAVVAVEDQRRGERLVLVTEEQSPDLEKLREAIRAEGLPDFYSPRHFLCLKIPLYPVGKINMPKLLQDVREVLAGQAKN